MVKQKINYKKIKVKRCKKYIVLLKMNTLDLNIENYNLEDILNLFKIPSNFDENDLKNAKKMVLKMHPDKSSLAPEYFLFFSKAYKMIYQMVKNFMP